MRTVIRTDYQLTHNAWGLMYRLGLDMESFAFKLFNRGGKQRTLARTHGTSDEFYVTTVIDRNIPDVEDFIQEILDRRIEYLKNLEDSQFFRLKRCIIDIEADRYEYRMGTSDRWERQ